MAYISQKNCRINGKNYNKGDLIVDLSAYEGARLVRYDIIREEAFSDNGNVSIAEALPLMIEVPILSLGKSVDFEPEDVSEALKILQMPSDEAVAYVKTVRSDSLCELLSFVDKRKGVVSALSKRSLNGKNPEQAEIDTNEYGGEE